MSDFIGDKEIYDNTMRVIELILQIYGAYCARADFYILGTNQTLIERSWAEIEKIANIRANTPTKEFIGKR